MEKPKIIYRPISDNKIKITKIYIENGITTIHYKRYINDLYKEDEYEYYDTRTDTEIIIANDYIY